MRNHRNEHAFEWPRLPVILLPLLLLGAMDHPEDPNDVLTALLPENGYRHGEVEREAHASPLPARRAVANVIVLAGHCSRQGGRDYDTNPCVGGSTYRDASAAIRSGDLLKQVESAVQQASDLPDSAVKPLAHAILLELHDETLNAQRHPDLVMKLLEQASQAAPHNPAIMMEATAFAVEHLKYQPGGPTEEWLARIAPGDPVTQLPTALRLWGQGYFGGGNDNGDHKVTVLALNKYPDLLCLLLGRDMHDLRLTRALILKAGVDFAFAHPTECQSQTDDLIKEALGYLFDVGDEAEAIRMYEALPKDVRERLLDVEHQPPQDSRFGTSAFRWKTTPAAVLAGLAAAYLRAGSSNDALALLQWLETTSSGKRRGRGANGVSWASTPQQDCFGATRNLLTSAIRGTPPTDPFADGAVFAECQRGGPILTPVRIVFARAISKAEPEMARVLLGQAIDFLDQILKETAPPKKDEKLDESATSLAGREAEVRKHWNLDLDGARSKAGKLRKQVEKELKSMGGQLSATRGATRACVKTIEANVANSFRLMPDAVTSCVMSRSGNVALLHWDEGAKGGGHSGASLARREGKRWSVDWLWNVDPAPTRRMR